MYDKCEREVKIASYLSDIYNVNEKDFELNHKYTVEELGK
jgi:hypothetical protein